MDNAIKNMMYGVILFVVAIILLVSVVLPQLHTGYAYVNNTLTTTEAPGLASIWGILYLLVTIVMFFSGLALIGSGVVSRIRGGGSKKKAR